MCFRLQSSSGLVPKTDSFLHFKVEFKSIEIVLKGMCYLEIPRGNLLSNIFYTLLLLLYLKTDLIDPKIIPTEHYQSMTFR